MDASIFSNPLPLCLTKQAIDGFSTDFNRFLHHQSKYG